MTDYFVDSQGYTVSLDDVALEHIRRMAHRLLSDDDIPAVSPAMLTVMREASK